MTVARIGAISCGPFLVLVGLVAFAVRLPFMVGPTTPMYVPDSWIYRVIADDLLAGRGFRNASELRTPGYPLLIAGVHWLTGSPTHALIIVQHLGGVACTIGAVWAAWRYFGRGAGLITGLVAAPSPILVNLEGDLMPDFLVGALGFAGALLVARALETPNARLRLMAAAGAVFGLGALVKPIGQFYVLAAFVPLLVDPRNVRRALIAGSILAVSLCVVISPWIIRNAVQFGNLQMSDQDGPSLWLREFDWDKRPIPTNTAEGRLVKKLYEATVVREPADGHPTDTYEFVLEALENKPYNYDERKATSIQRRVALEAIREAPWVYLRGTIAIFRTLTLTSNDQYWANVVMQAKIAQVKPSMPTGFSTTLFGYSRYLIKWWQILTLELASVILLAFTRSRRRRIGLASFGIAYVALEGATASAAFPDPRYSSEGEVMLWIIGSAGAALVLRGVAGAVRAGFRAPS